MMNKIFKLVVIAAGLAAAVSCQKYSGGKLISVRVTANDTKSVVTTTSSLEKSGQFVLDAYVGDSYVDGNTGTEYEAGNYIDKALVVMDGGEWRIGRDYYWVAGADMRFWAWHPVSIPDDRREISVPAPDSDVLEFEYTAPEVDGVTDADRAEDLLFAYTKQSYSEGNTTVALTFQHALSQVRFCISTNDGTFDTGLAIKSIKIGGLKNSGKASFTGEFTWYDLSGGEEFGQVYNADFSKLPAEGWTAGSYERNENRYDLHICQNVFFMVPQKVTYENMITVEFVITDNEEVVEKSVSIAPPETSTDWLAGRCYTYKLKATTLGRQIDASVVLVGWSYRDDKLFI